MQNNPAETIKGYFHCWWNRQMVKRTKWNEEQLLAIGVIYGGKNSAGVIYKPQKNQVWYRPKIPSEAKGMGETKPVWYLIAATPHMYIYPNKPIGAAPGCNYYLICVVAKKMVCTTINLVGTLQHCTVWYIIKGGNTLQGLRLKRARDDYVGYLILCKPHYCWGTKMTALLISPVLHQRSATTTIVTISHQIIIIFWIS